VTEKVDAVLVGGGIVGLAAGLALTTARPQLSLVILEKEATCAKHQTGHNSGVIHAGLYYRPGSLKARTCIRGRSLLLAFCEEHGVAVDRCGKVVVATANEELPRLDELERRATANGLSGVERWSPEQLREREPHAAGIAALYVPQTAIVDYAQVAAAYVRELERRGAKLRTGSRVVGVRPQQGEVVVTSTTGEMSARALVCCAGLESDRIARMAGLEPAVRIVPFLGEYRTLAPGRTHLVRHLIYPVPDPAFPFLGVHFTRRIGGAVEAGPNAVLALSREGYSRSSFDLRDAWDTATWPGFWRMAQRHWRAGAREQIRSHRLSAFARDCAKLVPEITTADLAEGGCGIRAQAVARDGALIDDFAIVEGKRMVHVVNAPSPAATASLAIGEEIAGRALAWM
jgi:(S)-2-hydroxyglutarate dehydrogenase